MTEIKIVKVYDDEEEFENECNELLLKGFCMIPNSFNVIIQENLNYPYYICLFQRNGVGNEQM